MREQTAMPAVQSWPFPAATNPPTAMLPIAVVEDDVPLLDQLVSYLRHAGLDAVGFTDGEALSGHMARRPCCMVVLDLNLPGEDGLEVCARIKQSYPKTGVVVITGRGIADDHVGCVQRGADGFVTKHATMPEVLYAISNVLRRLGHDAPAYWHYDPRTREVTRSGATIVQLARRDVLLLEMLLDAFPHFISREKLIAGLGHSEKEPEAQTRNLDVAISELRRKLGEIEPDRDVIERRRELGVRLLDRFVIADE